MYGKTPFLREAIYIIGIILGCGACSATEIEECAPLVNAPSGMVNIFPLEQGNVWTYDYTFSFTSEFYYPFLYKSQVGTIRLAVDEIGPCESGKRAIRTEHEISFDQVVRRDSSNGATSYDSSAHHATFTYHWTDSDGGLRLAGSWSDSPSLRQYSSDVQLPEIQRIRPDTSRTVSVGSFTPRDDIMWTFEGGKGLVQYWRRQFDPHGMDMSEKWDLREDN